MGSQENVRCTGTLVEPYLGCHEGPHFTGIPGNQEDIR